MSNGFLSKTAAAGDATSITFPAMPGKMYRVIFCDMSTLGGTGFSVVSVTGVSEEITGVANNYLLDLPADQPVLGAMQGLESKPNTPFVFTLGALAASVPKISAMVAIIPARS